MSKRRLTDYISVDVIVEKEAHGGFGDVYMGPDHTLNAGRWLALKTLHPRYLVKERGKRLFLNECLTWVGLWPHPNLIMAEAVTELDNQLHLVLYYAELGSLRDLLHHYAGSEGGRPLLLHSALQVAQHIAAGLLALHTPDPAFLRPDPIVHRDLKPENVLISNNIAMITDFGLAKVVTEMGIEEEIAADADDTDSDETNISGKAASMATQSRRYRTERGVAMGTYAYMPPEQWVDAVSAGPPADLYAFGIILGEILLGTHPLLPWEAGGYRASKDQWRRTHFEASPPPLATARTRAWYAARARMPDPPLLPELLKLFRGLLAKRAEDRPTAAEALAVLQRAAAFSGMQPYTAPEILPHTPEHECGKWHNWAISYFRFGQNDDALDRNDRALALASSHSSVLLNHHVLTMRGNILGAMGRIEEALTCYDRALARLPASDSNHRSVVLSMRGVYLKDAGYYERAEESFVEALQLTPESPVIWHDRAYNEWRWGEAFAKNGQREEAERHWQLGLDYVEQALPHNPNNPKITMLRDSLRKALGEG
jgi:serine/threonine protein kinase